MPLAYRRVACSLSSTVASFDALSSELALATAQDRIAGTLAAFFGGFTLLLAAIGVGGLVAYTVSQRREEFAIRMALGADLTHIVIDVLGSGTRIALAGTVVNVMAGVLSARAVHALLFGVEPTDPAVLLSVSPLILIVSWSACVLPACRAATANPKVGLRSD